MTAPTRRPRLKADEHPRPQVTVPMSVFGDLFFMDDHAKVGRFVHYWCAAVWKKDPTFFHPIVDSDLSGGLTHGWIVDADTPRLTGPRRDRCWLLDARKVWFTYAIEALGVDLVKVGHTIDVTRRLDELQCASPHQLTIIGCRRGDHEQDVHRALRPHHVSGEWFRLSAARETLARFRLGGQR